MSFFTQSIPNPNAEVRLSELASHGDEIGASGIWALAIDTLSATNTTYSEKYINIDDHFTTQQPLIIPRGYSVVFSGGGKITAVSPWSTITQDGKTVDAVVSGPTDSANGYWERGEIRNPFINANNLAAHGISLWRHRQCRISNGEILNAQRAGIRSHAVVESTSYEPYLTDLRVAYEITSQCPLVTTGFETVGYDMERTTDIEYSKLVSVNYNIGYRENSQCGGTNGEGGHYWGRPPHSMGCGVWLDSNGGSHMGVYADSPVIRDIAGNPNNLAPAAATAYGLRVSGTGNTIGLRVYTNPTNDGAGRPYTQDLQVVGVYSVSPTAGNNRFISPSFTGGQDGATIKRIARAWGQFSLIGGTSNVGSEWIIGPVYANVDQQSRGTAFQQEINIRRGGISQTWRLADFDNGTGFGNVAVDLSAYPQNNGATAKEAYMDFWKTSGSTGSMAIRFYNGTADGGSVLSDQINHQLSVKNEVSFLAHSKATEFPLIRIGAQSSALQPVGLSPTSRETLSRAALSVDRPSVFNAPLMLPRYTTAQRSALGGSAQQAAIIYNTDTGRIETTADGSTWVASVTAAERYDHQSTQSFTGSGTISAWGTIVIVDLAAATADATITLPPALATDTGKPLTVVRVDTNTNFTVRIVGSAGDNVTSSAGTGLFLRAQGQSLVTMVTGLNQVAVVANSGKPASTIVTQTVTGTWDTQNSHIRVNSTAAAVQAIATQVASNQLGRTVSVEHSAGANPVSIGSGATTVLNPLSYPLTSTSIGTVWDFLAVDVDTWLLVGYHGAIISGSSGLKQTHTSGAAVTVADTTSVMIVNPATLLATLAITLPTTGFPEGRVLDIVFGGDITSLNPVVTALTVGVPGGMAIISALTPVSAISGDSLSYARDGSVWRRL